MPAQAEPSADPASNSRLLPEAEFAGILDKIISTQRSLVQVNAVFRITLQENLQLINSSYIQAHPELTINDGLVNGSIRWQRDGVRELVETTYDLPKDVLRHNYDDQVLFDDSEKQIGYYPRTHQAAIVRSGGFNLRTPMFWLNPGGAGGFSRFREKGDYELRGFEEPQGTVLIQVFRQSANVFSARCDRELDYAVTQSWTNQGHTRWNIDYSRGNDGQLLPKRAEFRVQEGDGALVRHWVLEVQSLLRQSPLEGVTFSMPPGTIVADNRRELYGGEVQAFEVDAHGQLQPVEAIPYTSDAIASSVPRRQFGIGLIGVAGISIALGYRFYSARKIRTNRDGIANQ